MNETLRVELIWALDNIPPWDEFWCSVPSKHVKELTSTPVAPIMTGNKKPRIRGNRSRRRKTHLNKQTVKDVGILANIDDIRTKDFQTLREVKDFFNQFGIFSKVGFGKYKDHSWNQIPRDYYESCKDFTFKNVGDFSVGKSRTKTVAIMSLVMDEYRKQIRKFVV